MSIAVLQFSCNLSVASVRKLSNPNQPFSTGRWMFQIAPDPYNVDTKVSLSCSDVDDPVKATKAELVIISQGGKVWKTVEHDFPDGHFPPIMPKWVIKFDVPQGKQHNLVSVWFFVTPVAAAVNSAVAKRGVNDERLAGK